MSVLDHAKCSVIYSNYKNTYVPPTMDGIRNLALIEQFYDSPDRHIHPKRTLIITKLFTLCIVYIALIFNTY